MPLGSGRQRLRGPFSRWPRIADGVVAVVLFAMTLFLVEGPNQTLAVRTLGDVPVGAFLVFGAACAAIVWRRERPLVVLAVTLGATNLAAALEYSDLVGLTLLIALYSVGRYVTSDRTSHLGLGAALVVTLSSPLFDDVTAAETGFALVFMSMIWYLGRRVRVRGERAAQHERERVAEASRAIAEERSRIARELHDVVAHRVSLMTVQAGAAKTVAIVDPESAQRAMEAVEKAGRQALDELRQLLGVLRPKAELHRLGPQPGLADVPRLVDQFEEAGLHVSMSTNGLPADLPASVGLSAYRIVQEALTNVLKHAGPGSQAEVRIFFDSQGVGIEVSDDGHAASILPGAGHGIVGMRERALLLGGSLDAGPHLGGGFRVVAHLPVGEGSP